MTEPPAELRATYRLQLTSEFGFESARSLIPYLRDLGVSHLYLSPSLQARAGSTHGYDQIDPSRLSEALGGEEAFRRLAGGAQGAGMGLVLDVVPNHMAADDENRFWADPELRRQFFDIDPVSGRWRRFFDIDDLAGIRQEDPEVFEATHGFVLRLVQQGLLDGLRVDHPDGLADPQGYLRRLRDGGARRVWVEKILSPTERLPSSWPVSGTVGYEFLNDVSTLFVDPEGEAPLTALWEQVSGDERPFGAWALEAKLEQARTTFAPEVERLTRLAPELDADAVALALSALPVYRTYVEPSAGEFLTRFQQTSPAIMAKGVEDTTFYRYARLLALNEVGGDPSRFGLGVEEFHSGNAERQVRFPEGLLTTMTHDAKRSADVRARVGALAGMAEEWADRVERWMALSDELCGSQGGPDDAERYFIFQTLAGIWPIEAERLDAYLEKALREAKRNTNWTCPNADWEEAVKRFTRQLVADRRFMDDFEPFAQRVTARGRRSALGQTVLKLSSPGVPDIYQGDELEFRALVDPDNRRAVDWSLRRALLARLLGGGQLPDEPKLTVTARLLGLRARRPDPFARGRYEPLDAGPDTCAFLRGDDVLVAVRLRPGAEPPSLAGTGRPGGEWRELLGYSQLGVAVWERA